MVSIYKNPDPEMPGYFELIWDPKIPEYLDFFLISKMKKTYFINNFIYFIKKLILENALKKNN